MLSPSWLVTVTVELRQRGSRFSRWRSPLERATGRPEVTQPNVDEARSVRRWRAASPPGSLIDLPRAPMLVKFVLQGLQSIRTKTCSRAEKNFCHPPWAPW
jgi:hypothetical protein